jgi:hypothetical protein
MRANPIALDAVISAPHPGPAGTAVAAGAANSARQSASQSAGVQSIGISETTREES